VFKLMIDGNTCADGAQNEDQQVFHAISTQVFIPAA
jgi:hypothetical protein